MNIAKHVSNKKYVTCYTIEKTYCAPDPKSTVSLSVKPQFLFYQELFMSREGQKELKLNFVTKLPTSVLLEIKTLYKKYIEECYKKDIVIEDAKDHMKKNKQAHKQSHKQVHKQAHKQVHKHVHKKGTKATHKKK
jgi:hypothetical protein